MSLMERMVIRETETGRLYRVVITNPIDTWLMPMDGNGWAERESTSHANGKFKAGTYVEQAGNEVQAQTRRASEHANTTYKRFKPYLQDTAKLVTEEGRGEVFRLMKAETGVSKAAFYKTMRRWLRGGCVPQSLAADWRPTNVGLAVENLSAMSYAAAEKAARAQATKLMLEGNPPAEYLPYTKSGRQRQRRRLKPRTLYKVDLATVRLFDHYFKALNSTPGKGLPSQHRDMCAEVFSTRQATGDVVLWPEWAVPSWNQFKDWYYNLNSHQSRRRRIRGHHHYDLNERARPGQGLSIAYTAGHVGSADATIWNVELVDDAPGSVPIGLAVVFRIRCKDHGQLLGIGASLESASWMGMASAIANCAEDKVAFCKRYGIDITEDYWNVRGVPGAIEADCGETDNKKPYRFVRYTRCELRNLPPARPDLKPGVESDWNTLEVHLNELAPGAIISRYEDIKRDKWRLKARMTLWAFMRMLLLEELKRMHTPREGLTLPAAMIADGVDSSPHSMYSWSVKNGAGGMRRFDEDQVRLSLLESAKASVTDSGLEFKGLLYLAPELEVAEALDYARRHGRRKLVVAYDPRLVNHVYILQGDPECPSGYTQCTLNRRRPDQRDFWDKTFRAVFALQEKQASNNANKVSAARDLLANITRLQKETAAEAEALATEQRALDPRSDTARLKGRAAAREAAKDASSPGQAILPSTAQASASAQSPPSAPNVTPITGAARPRRGSGFAAGVEQMQGKSPPKAIGAEND